MAYTTAVSVRLDRPNRYPLSGVRTVPPKPGAVPLGIFRRTPARASDPSARAIISALSSVYGSGFVEDGTRYSVYSIDFPSGE